MGKNIKIICTIVPNPTRTKETGKSSFSVFLTPRLPDSGILKDYYEIVNWFKFLSVFTDNRWLKVRLAKLTTSNNIDYILTEESHNGYRVSRDNGLCSRDYLQQYKTYSEKDYYLLGRKIWEKMFQNNTPIRGWIFDEGDNKDNKVTQIFTKDEIETLIETANQKREGRTIADVVESLDAETKNRLPKSLKLDDIAGKRMSEDEIRFRNKENQEFHKKISVLADYPHLLRLTGWVFDFQVEANISNIAFDIVKLDLSDLPDFVRNQSDASLWANFSNEIDFKTPWTYVNKISFSIRYLDKLKKEYFEIENGFMKASGDAYDLIACQFDHNQLKGKLQAANTTESEKILKVIENNASDLTSTGIGIKVVKKNKLSPFEKGVYSDPDSLNSSITIKQGDKIIKNDSANIDDYIIFGHNLDTGYRVDVAISKDGGTTFSPFQSLCWRNADYKIDTSPYSDKKAFINLLTNFKDEPWISESAQAGKSGMLYVDEELCRWNNWSLTCPHIGNYPQDETNVKENHEFNDLELKNIRPTDMTLTPLRFSRKYKFRIRVVDICGNSSNESDSTTPAYEIILKDDSITTPRESEYKRLETANPPELHFIENIFEGKLKNTKGDFVERKLREDFYGEDLNTFVVRTKIKGNNFIIPEDSIRSVCPPRVTQSFVELHGTIDELLKDPKERKSVYEKASYENTNTDVEIFKPKEEIPFLTDPITTFFDVHVFQDNQKTIQINSNGSNANIWKNDIDYINRKFNSIQLKSITPKDSKNEVVTKSENSVCVELKVGSIFHGEIESIISDKSSFHSDSFFKDNNGNSKHSLPRELLFINAVQKPVIPINDGTMGFMPTYNLDGVLRKRTPYSPISLAFESLAYPPNGIPLSTTGEIKIIAEYDEIICDKTKEHGFRLENKKLIKAFSNFGEDISLKINDNSDSTKLLGIPEFRALEHSFGDTKYRSVKYSIELVSRFKDFFPNENEFSVLGTFSKPVKVENSKKLESLVIDSIVPVFSWEESENEVVRKQDTFRIYLDGDWYQNGASIEKNAKGEFVKFEEEEKIAVFFLEKEDTIPDEYEGLVSEFGKDPSTNSNNDRTKGLYKDLFNASEFIDGSSDPNEKINSLLLERGESSFSLPVQAPVNAKDIKAAIFPVTFDSIKKKFFCDVKLNIDNEKRLYFPFLKLAVARYLKTSIKEDKKYDYRFSNVVTAPQVQIFPLREINKNSGDINFESLQENIRSKNIELYLIMEINRKSDFHNIIENNLEMNSTKAIRLDSKINLPSILNGNIIPEIETHYDILKLKSIEKQIKEFKPSNIYLEEYEIYNVFDKWLENDFHVGSLTENKNQRFFINGKFKFGFLEKLPENYNPRNDIRKRLVFTYQIK
jgi:hypothetical protein